MEDIEETFLCDCHSVDHLVHFWYMRPTEKDPEDVIYATALFSPFRGFFRRLKDGLKFLLGDNYGPDGVFQPITMQKKDYARLEKILGEQIGDQSPAIKSDLVRISAGKYALSIAYEVYGHEHGCDHDIVFRVFYDNNSPWSQCLYFLENLLFFGHHYSDSECFTLTPEDSKIIKDMICRCRIANLMS